jgi:hypothetical protein
MNRTARILCLVLITAATALVVAALPRIPQDPAYHNFADQRSFLGVANAFDVLSNIPFLLVGLFATWFLLHPQSKALFTTNAERWLFALFFIGAAFVGIGSGYYHIAPNNDTLVWDRLPMTLGFMGLVSALLAERIGPKAGLVSAPPLLLLGLASVIYWKLSESHGHGDLRFYAFVQYFPLILVPLLLWLFPARYTRSLDYLGVLGFYIAAKLAEHFDRFIFSLTHVVSGHTLKHLLAAGAVAWIFRMLLKRTIVFMQATEPKHCETTSALP